MERNLLFISKYPEIKEEFRRALVEKEIELDIADNGADAANFLKSKEYQVIVTGMVVDGFRGEQILNYVNQKHPDTVCMIYTASINAVQLAFYLNKGNIFRVFLRPMNFREEFIQALDDAYEYYELKKHDGESRKERLKQLRQNRKAIVDMKQQLQWQSDGWKGFENLSDLILSYSMERYGKIWTDKQKETYLTREKGLVHEMCQNPDVRKIATVQRKAGDILKES